MQNKCNNCDAGFVSLSGDWSCGGCGCSNCGCDTCSNCGWNRWGCNNGCGCSNGCGCGSVVAVGNSRNNGRSNDGCHKDCQNETYTRQRSGSYRGREYQNRSSDCGCSDASSYGTRSTTVECCDNNTYIRETSGDSKGSTYSRQGRSSDCDKCDNGSTYTRTRNSGCDKCDNGSTYTQSRSSGCDKCDNGSTYTRTRSGDCDKCDECGSTYTHGRSNGCDKCDNDSAYTRSRSNGCDKCDNDSTYPRSRKNRGVGMVWAAKQELDQVFESESALRTGTLFPELHKPMNGYCPGDCNCQTDEQAAAFAAWELRLYLNTHPDDKQAMALFRKLCEETDEPNYATTFLKDDCCASDWGWTDDPWPWECRPCGK